MEARVLHSKRLVYHRLADILHLFLRRHLDLGLVWIVWELNGDRKDALNGLRGIFSIGLAIGGLEGGGVCNRRRGVCSYC